MTFHLELTGASKPPSTLNETDMIKAPHADALAAAVRKTLRSEFTRFFELMLREEPQWPHISEDEFIDALADSLIAMGKTSNRADALLQTLVYELQERINANKQG